MKKDRQSFFNEANFSQSSFVPTPNFGMNTNYPMNGAYGQAQASQSFYSGPSPMPYNQSTMGSDYMSDIESRLAKIERQINRLDARISKLESKGMITTENFENTNNMYML